jgi:hypothetical protein
MPLTKALNTRNEPAIINSHFRELGRSTTSNLRDTKLRQLSLEVVELQFKKISTFTHASSFKALRACLVADKQQKKNGFNVIDHGYR